MAALPILEIHTSSSQGTEDQSSDSYKLSVENFVSVLSKVDCPFAIYCMSGTSRIGKSYTLNKFIERLTAGRREPEKLREAPSQDMFNWRNGVNRETTGINLWSEPFFVTQGGKKVAILLMDAQGLFDNQTTTQQNAVIFAICSLLASVCIYNVVRKISAEDLQHINYFSMYSRAIPRNSSQNGDGNDDSGELQKLVIMVRDFNDVHEYGFGYHDKDEAPLNDGRVRNNYFKHMFLSDDRLKVPAENVATKKGICESYKHIGIVLNPDPGSKFKRYPKTTLPKEEFSLKLGDFIELMISEKHLVTKKIGGHEITGIEFIHFVEHLSFICEHAKDHFPAAKTIEESAIAFANSLVISNSSQVFKHNYQEFLDSADDADDEALEREYGVILQKAIQVYKRGKTMGNKVIVGMGEKQVVDECKAIYKSLKDIYGLKQKFKKQSEFYQKQNEIDAERFKKLEKEIRLKEQMGEDASQLVEKLAAEAKESEKQNNEFKKEQEKMKAEIMRLENRKLPPSSVWKEILGYLEYVPGVGTVAKVINAFIQND